MGNQEATGLIKPYYSKWTFKDRYGGFLSRVIGRNRKKAREDYYSFMQGLVRRRVQSPYEMGARCALGDVFLESAMDAGAVHRVMEAYGIEDVSSVFDPASNVTVETVIMHGKHAAIKDTFGHKISDPNSIPDLAPTSELAQVSGYLENVTQPEEYWAGHAAERVIRDRLDEMGYDVMLPLSSNQEGYDLLVDERFFRDHGLPFTKDVETGLGMLQVKNVASDGAVTRHLDRFGDSHDGAIPVVAPDDVAEHFANEPVVAFSEIGLDRDEVVATVTSQLEDLAKGHYADVAVGMDTTAFQDAVEGYGGVGFDSAVPWLGVIVATSLQSYRSYQLFSTGKIDGMTMFKDVARAGGAALVVGTATKVAAGITTGVALWALPGVDSTSEVFAEGIGAAGDIIGGDFELGDLGDLGEFAIVAGVLIGTAWLVHKGIGAVTGQIQRGYGAVSGYIKQTLHPSLYKKLERLNESHGKALVSLRQELSASRAILLNVCGKESYDFHRNRLQVIKNEFASEERKFDDVDTLPSLRYFFLEYARNKQANVVAEMESGVERSPLGFFMEFYSDFQPDFRHSAGDETTAREVQKTYQAAAVVHSLKGHARIPNLLTTAAITLLERCEELADVLKEFKEKNLPLPELKQS